MRYALRYDAEEDGYFVTLSEKLGSGILTIEQVDNAVKREDLPVAFGVAYNSFVNKQNAQIDSAKRSPIT